jgi:hypothetical protein
MQWCNVPASHHYARTGMQVMMRECSSKLFSFLSKCLLTLSLIHTIFKNESDQQLMVFMVFQLGRGEWCFLYRGIEALRADLESPETGPA